MVHGMRSLPLEEGVVLAQSLETEVYGENARLAEWGFHTLLLSEQREIKWENVTH